MREVSDRLCREYAISVIENPGGRAKHYAEWQAEQNGKPTHRGTIRADIDRAILASTTERDFLRVMGAVQLGYIFTQQKRHPLDGCRSFDDDVKFIAISEVQRPQAGNFLPGLSPHTVAPGRTMHYLREWHLLLEVVQNTLFDLTVSPSVPGRSRKTWNG